MYKQIQTQIQPQIIISIQGDEPVLWKSSRQKKILSKKPRPKISNNASIKWVRSKEKPNHSRPKYPHVVENQKRSS